MRIANVQAALDANLALIYMYFDLAMVVRAMTSSFYTYIHMYILYYISQSASKREQRRTYTLTNTNTYIYIYL